MERKSCCGSRSYLPSSCVSTIPNKETIPVMTPPKKEEDVKPQITTTHEEDAQVGVIQTPKTEEKQAETVKSEVPDIKIDEVVTDLNQERPPSEETLAKFEAQLTDIFKVENKLNNFCVQFSTNSPSKT
ncbi:hypothetical protein JRO89_XS06G0113100 [Xanthoceras sorbifolium]|uniref:Uncharacterized protein n=1 Tax=Xanthoceras sorbifolium TaxID=99658 RepID=A0ABQ8HXP9_9ROSI|nr:hypothetical protein JRO89_XS06G0113100 [Xanthoceras sorbifolium]